MQTYQKKVIVSSKQKNKINLTKSNWFKAAKHAEGYGLSRFMRYGYDYGMSAGVNPESRIKVEEMNADVLLLAVENDDCWPSEVATRRMMKKPDRTVSDALSDLSRNGNLNLLFKFSDYHEYDNTSSALPKGSCRTQ